MDVSGQFTGNELLLFLNGELVASVNLVEDTAAQNRSSVCLSVGRWRVPRHDRERQNQPWPRLPVLEAFTVQDATVGLWDFNDEIPSMDLRFFGNAHEASPSQGRDGPGDSDGRLDPRSHHRGIAFVTAVRRAGSVFVTLTAFRRR